MTGMERNPESVFREITECELLAENYRKVRLAQKMRDERKSGPKIFVKSNLERTQRVLKRLYHRAFFEKEAEGSSGLCLDRKRAAERKALYVRRERIAVYTALYGMYDIVREPLLSPENVDYYLLTDQPFSENSLWKECGQSGILPREILGDPVLCNRWYKMHPHLLFPEYTYSIYVDSSFWIISDLTPAAAGLDKYPVAMFQHKNRNCVYDEVQACIEQGKADPVSLREHEKVIRSHHIPRHWGMVEAGFIARKHNDPCCMSLMDSWWEAFLKNSRRDQISLIDVMWQAGIRPEQVGTLGFDLNRCRLILPMDHRRSNGAKEPMTLEELRSASGHGC